jgi:leucyl/phenylalanyl-tRNA--protein transferase
MNLVIPEEFFLDAQDAPFPDIDLALDEPNGLIAIGGDLSSQRLISHWVRPMLNQYQGRAHLERQEKIPQE